MYVSSFVIKFERLFQEYHHFMVHISQKLVIKDLFAIGVKSESENNRNSVNLIPIACEQGHIWEHTHER